MATFANALVISAACCTPPRKLQGIFAVYCKKMTNFFTSMKVLPVAFPELILLTVLDLIIVLRAEAHRDIFGLPQFFIKPT